MIISSDGPCFRPRSCNFSELSFKCNSTSIKLHQPKIHGLISHLECTKVGKLFPVNSRLTAMISMRKVSWVFIETSVRYQKTIQLDLDSWYVQFGINNCKDWKKKNHFQDIKCVSTDSKFQRSLDRDCNKGFVSKLDSNQFDRYTICKLQIGADCWSLSLLAIVLDLHTRQPWLSRRLVKTTLHSHQCLQPGVSQLLSSSRPNYLAGRDLRSTALVTQRP